jgi:hypothetical protein
MNPTVIFDAVVGFLRAANAVLSIVPALVWAVVLLLALGYGSVMHHERDSAVSERNTVQAMYEQLTTKVIHQKLEAAALLKKLTAERDALQAQINHDHDEQEKKDASNKKTIAAQAARLDALSAASPGGRLRDPNAGRGCSGASAEGHAAGDERGSEDHGAAAGGLVSAQLSGLLRGQAAGADKWARLYDLARADALMCRAALGSP